MGWVWVIHTLLNGPKWAIGFLRTQPIYYPPKPTQTHLFDTPSWHVLGFSKLAINQFVTKLYPINNIFEKVQSDENEVKTNDLHILSNNIFILY